MNFHALIPVSSSFRFSPFTSALPPQRALDRAEIEARGAALDALRAECAATSATLAAARSDAESKSAEAAEVECITLSMV